MANLKDLIVNGVSRFIGKVFINDSQINKINNVTVGSTPKFTDTVTTASTTGSGNAVTAISASNGAITVTKGTTFLTSHQDISGKADKSATVSTVAWDSTNKKLTKTINGTTSDVVTAATLRTGLNVADGAEVNQNAFSNVVVGSTTIAADGKTDTLTLAAGSNVTLTPDATNDKVTIAATDTTYSSKAAASGGTDVSLVTTGEKYTWNNKTSNTGTVTKVTAGTGLSVGSTAGGNFTTSGTINHTNSVTAQTTQAIYPIKIDAQGHISAYGTAVTPLTSHQTIKQDGVTGATANRFGACSTAAATAAKTVSITTGTFTLETGAKVTVKFANKNTANSPTLNVNSTGAKNIFHNGAQITSGTNKGMLYGTIDFVYDGTQWQLIGNYVDTNTAQNQNAFSNVKVGSTTIAADTTTDTLELTAGSNVTLTPDATNDKVTIAALDGAITTTTTEITANKPLKFDFPNGYINWHISNTLTSSTNLNSITYPCTAWCDNVTNKPSSSGQWGTFFCIGQVADTQNNVQQFYTDFIGSGEPIMYVRWYLNNQWYAWRRISTSQYEDHTFQGAIAAGTIGTRGLQLAYSIDYEPTNIQIIHVQSSDKYIPIPFYASNNVYCNWYRATSAAITAADSKVIVRIFK